MRLGNDMRLRVFVGGVGVDDVSLFVLEADRLMVSSGAIAPVFAIVVAVPEDIRQAAEWSGEDKPQALQVETVGIVATVMEGIAVNVDSFGIGIKSIRRGGRWQAGRLARRDYHIGGAIVGDDIAEDLDLVAGAQDNAGTSGQCGERGSGRGGVVDIVGEEMIVEYPRHPTDLPLSRRARYEDAGRVPGGRVVMQVGADRVFDLYADKIDSVRLPRTTTLRDWPR